VPRLSVFLVFIHCVWFLDALLLNRNGQTQQAAAQRLAINQPPSAAAPRRVAVRSIAWLGHIVFMSKSAALKESAEERRRFIRDADNLVRCLTIEFEIELGLGSTVVPVGKKFERAPSQAPLCERGASDGDAHTRRLPGDPAFLCDRFGRGDDAARDETWPAFLLAREDEDRIAFGDVLATIHRLLRPKRERLRLWIANLSFDRERDAFHFAPLVS